MTRIGSMLAAAGLAVAGCAAGAAAAPLPARSIAGEAVAPGPGIGTEKARSVRRERRDNYCRNMPRRCR